MIRIRKWLYDLSVYKSFKQENTKLDGYRLRMTVNVRPRGKTQMLVRANAQYNLKAVEDPEPYQQFFAAFEKAMFLTAHYVE